MIDGQHLDESIEMDGWKQYATVCLWDDDDSSVATTTHDSVQTHRAGI